MTTSSSTFPESERYKPADLDIGAIIPKKTYISGRLVLLFPVEGDHSDRLRFAVRAKYQANVAESEYVAASPSISDKWKFMFHLEPRRLPPPASASSGQTIKEAVLAEHERMALCMGAEIRMMADDLRIIKVDGKNVDFEAVGPRTMWTEKTGSWTIFQDPSQSSVTPSWLESDRSLSSPAGPTTQVQAQAGPSNFRPITSHIPSLLNLRPTNEPIKRKRTSSPEKLPRDTVLVQREPPAKRTSVVAEEAVSHFGPRTFELPVGQGSSSRAGGEGQPEQLQEAAPAHTPNHAPLAVPHSIPSAGLARPSDGAPYTTRPSTKQSSTIATGSSNDIDTGTNLSSPTIMPPDRGRAARQAALLQEGRAIAQPKSAREEAENNARNAARKKLEEQQAESERRRQKGLALHTGLRTPNLQYQTVKELRTGAIANVMGMVASVTPPRALSGRFKDHIMSLVISDPSSFQGGEPTAEDLVVTIFRKTDRELPVDIQPGTPILFRQIKLNTHNNKVKGNAFSAGGNTWAYLDDKKLRHADTRLMNPAITKAEVDRLMDLRCWWQALGQSIPAETSNEAPIQRQGGGPAPRGRRAMLLGDTRHGDFFDTTFKIIHVESGRSVHFELYVTDGSFATQPIRNFHNVTVEDVPDNAIFCVSIEAEPGQDDLPKFQVGRYLHLPNVRAKLYKEELEMIWSERLLEDQHSQGWRDRKVKEVEKTDSSAIAIDQRLAELKKGTREGRVPDRPDTVEELDDQYIRPSDRIPSGADQGKPTPHAASHHLVTSNAGAVSPAGPHVAGSSGPSNVAVATHLHTTFRDPIDHPESTIAEILLNNTFPNKYRVKARVIAVHPRGVPGNSTLVQKHCRKCQRGIKKLFCQSCQDVGMIRASWQYRFIAILQEEERGPRLPILICGAEAEKFLPSLPPVSPSTNPNDQKKTKRQIEETTSRVMGVLQGGMMDGVRPVPYIDWTLQATIVNAPKGHVGARGEKGIVVYKAFGMVAR